jgi:L-fucose isomerase-like protein
MGIAGSMVNADFFQNYLGMRTEYVDMSEFVRRIDEKIYDPQEFDRAMAWVKAHCPESKDWNRPAVQKSREKKDAGSARRDHFHGVCRIDEYYERARSVGTQPCGDIG